MIRATPAVAPKPGPIFLISVLTPTFVGPLFCICSNSSPQILLIDHDNWDPLVILNVLPSELSQREGEARPPLHRAGGRERLDGTCRSIMCSGGAGHGGEESDQSIVRAAGLGTEDGSRIERRAWGHRGGALTGLGEED